MRKRRTLKGRSIADAVRQMNYRFIVSPDPLDAKDECWFLIDHAEKVIWIARWLPQEDLLPGMLAAVERAWQEIRRAEKNAAA